MKYKASLTGISFLLFEVKLVGQLLLENYTDTEIRQKVTDENLFQYLTQKSINRRVNYILRRLRYIDKQLLQFLVKGDLETSNIINLYTIYNLNLIFSDFLYEVVREKFLLQQYKLQDVDLNMYFRSKAEQSEDVAKWTESTINKLKQVFKQILKKSGLMDSNACLQRMHIYPDLKQHLIDIRQEKFIKCIEGY